MNIKFIKCTFISGLLLLPMFSFSQSTETWTLQRCIDYALEQNINIQKNKITLEQNKINTLQAKAQMFPSLSFSTSHSLNNSPFLEDDLDKDNTTYNGNYGLNASWTVFNGFKRKYNISQQQLQEMATALNISSNELDLKITIATCYIQILYAQETIKTNKNSLETSQAEFDRANQLLKSGTISKSDLSQIEAQVYSDKYQVIVAENNLEEMKLQLKQLLELDITQDIDIPEIEISDDIVLQPIQDKNTIYQNAKSVNPNIKNDSISKAIAALETKKAKSSYYPTISMSAGVSTGHNSSSNNGFGTQMKNNFGENLGLSLQYPIFDNRERKSTLQKAKLSEKSTELECIETEKNLIKTIESAYLDAVSAQNSFIAANENLKSAEISYDLVEQKYNYGMKTPFELLTEKNSLLSRKQAKIQAKYMALLNMQILNIYQDLPIEIGQ